LRCGKKIPAKALGSLPGGLIDAWYYARAMKWAWPASLALFLFCSDYATAIAFAGLDFDYVDQAGPQAPVLSLGKRNDYFPYDGIGDPLLPFTTSRLELLLESPTSLTPQPDEILHLTREETMVASFLGAADAIARGESVFLEQNDEILNDPTLLVIGRTADGGYFKSVTDSTVIYGSNSVLAAINREIPLDCSEDVMIAVRVQRDQDEWMTAIEEHRGHDDWTTESRIPDCRFTSTRTSGIHGVVESNRRPEITAFASVGSGLDAKLLIGNQGSVDDGSTFVFPYDGLYLARELPDFREGRRVFDFQGVQIGHSHIPFELTVISSGRSLANPPSALDPTDQNTLRSREYTLISSVKDPEGNCPHDPSGSEDSSCMVTVKITCETFGSEIGFGGLLHGYGGGDSSGTLDLPSQLEHNCVFDGDIEIIWGRNYAVDPQLLAAVAGIQSRNIGWASTLLRKRTLSIHSIPSALFLLGTLDSRASIEEVRSTTINGIFVAFMCVPACLCVVAGCVYLVGMKYLLPIPDNGSAAIELGAKIAQQHETQVSMMPLKVVLSRPFGWNGKHLVLDMDDETGSGERVGSQLKEQVGNEHRDQDQGVWGDELKNGAAPVVKKSHAVTLPEETGMQAETFGLQSNIQDAGDSNELKAGVQVQDTDQATNTRQQYDCEKGRGEEGQLPTVQYDTAMDRNQMPTKIPSEYDDTSDQATGNNLDEKATEAIADSVGRGTGIYVVACMLFCVVAAILSTGFIVERSVLSDETKSRGAILLPIEHENAPTDGQRQQGVPSYCFVNGNDLRTALSAYLHGAEEVQTGIIEQYGRFEDWCVDYVDDMSFVFAGISKDHKLNASSWNVSRATKFAFCFYDYDFADGVFDISQWDVSNGIYFHGMFYRAKRLEADLRNWNVSSGIAFNSMFQHSNFNADLSQWDVSSANSLRAMFAHTSSNPDLTKWDVSSVTDFSSMFHLANSFNADISQWDVSSGNDFSWMFYWASRFNADISQWDVGSGTDFGWMFSSANSFNANISVWDVSSGTGFGSMFALARNFNSDISHWDVSLGTDFSHMFSSAISFNADISEWEVSSGTLFAHMFSNANSFDADLSQWDVSAGIDFSWMFYLASNFNADISEWDVSSGVHFGRMFSFTDNFNVNISQWDVSSGTDFSSMFANAGSFNGDVSPWDVSSGTAFGSMFSFASAFNGDVSQWDVSSGINFGLMFSWASSFNGDVSQWDVSSGIDFKSMFYYADNFNGDLSEWDVSSGADFSRMFSDAKSFNGNISDWDVSSGTDFSWMFYWASNFNGDLSQWDVSSGTDFSWMFYLAGNFNTDLSEWDVSSATKFGNMFSLATKFNSDISKWDVSSAVDFNRMFSNANSFNADVSQWDVSSGTDFSWMFNSFSFNQDMCDWREHMVPDSNTVFMFFLSGCRYDDVADDAMCHKCSPTPSPTMLPSQFPSVSPTVSPSQSPSHTHMPSNSFTPSSGACFDTADWTDSFGDGCIWYVINGCSGAEDWANGNGQSALDACCTCGGGAGG